MEKQIVLKDIKKDFKTKQKNGKIHVLKGIDLTIGKGEMVAVKGASGAGKSTLLHILGCLDKPTSGMYLLNDRDLSKVPSASLAKIRNRKFGFVMQHFALIEDDTVLQNVGIPLVFGETPFWRVNKLAMEQLELVGIAHLASKKASQLSGGEKQRVAIARALVNHPQILLADEPTGALDSKNSTLVMEIFKELNKQGKTVIIVTHDNYVAQKCDRIITIFDGRITTPLQA